MRNRFSLPSSFGLVALLAAGPSVAFAQGDLPNAGSVSPAPGPSLAGRPEAVTVGVGAGYNTAGGDSLKPNVASVRIVLSEKLVLEPSVNLSHAKSRVAAGAGANADGPSTTTLDFGAMGRFQMATRGDVDLSVLGGARFAYGSTDAANDTDTQTFNLLWGVGLTYFLNSQWSLSFDVVNPLFLWTRTHQDQGDVSNSNYRFGAIFVPNAQAMIHLYF